MRIMKKMLLMVLMLALVCPVAVSAGGMMALHTDNMGVNFDSVCALGDAIYITDWSGLYSYRMGDTAPTMLTSSSEENVNIRTLVSSGDTLYMLCETWDESKSGMQLRTATVEGSKYSLGEPLALEWSNMMVEEGENNYSRSVEGAVICEGKLYLLSQDSRGEKTDVFSFDMADGKCTPRNDLPEVIGLFPYKDGKLLAALRKEGEWNAPMSLGIFDPQTGAVERKVTYEGKFWHEYGGYAYEAQSDRIYYTTSGSLYAMTGWDFAGSVSICAMPVANYYSIPRPGLLLGDTHYAAYTYERLVIQDVRPSSGPERTLCISTYEEADARYFAYAAQHPEVSVVLTNNMSDEAIIKNMMSRDEKTDIYLLSMSGDAYRALKQRGFLGKIEGEDALAFLHSAYPVVADAITASGNMVAIPSSSYSNSLSYEPSAMEKLGLTKETLPANWLDMIDFIANWDEAYGKDFPEMTVVEPSMLPFVRRELLNLIMTDYLAWMSSAGGQLTFDTPQLRAVLEKLDAADFSAITTEESENGYSWDGDSVLFTTWGTIAFSDYRGTSKGWLLSIVPDQPPILPLDMNVYVVNPFSKNQDIAGDYLNMLARNMPDSMRATLCPDMNEPIRERYYQRNLMSMQTSVKQSRELYEKASATEKQAYEGYLKESEKQLEDYEKEGSWSATVEDIAEYRTLAQNMIVCTSVAYSTQIRMELYEMISRYADGQLDREQFIRGIDQKLRMAEMEGY